jgi:hypothetical protein
MEKIEINVVDDILRSRVLVFDYGKPVKELISKSLGTITSPTLFVLNLKKANPMDYKFIKVAFDELIIDSRTNCNIFIVFKLDNTEFEELCYGLTDIFKLKIEQDETRTLLDSGFSMIYSFDHNKARYLSPLSSRHMEVLAEIEENQSISSTDIQEKFSLIAEDTSTILSDLLTCKFIIKTSHPSPQYIAVKTFI